MKFFTATWVMLEELHIEKNRKKLNSLKSQPNYAQF